MKLTTATFACLALLAAADPAAAAGPTTRPAVAPATQPAADDGSLARFPTFGAAFAVPAGWAEIPREKAGRVGQWIGPDSQPAAIKSMIMIETGRPGSGASPEVL